MVVSLMFQQLIHGLSVNAQDGALMKQKKKTNFGLAVTDLDTAFDMFPLVGVGVLT